MSYEIFTDSTANLPNQIIERFKLNVIPVPVIVNGEITYSYEKDGKNDLKVFYDRLRKKESISTSCINEEAFAEAFEKTRKARLYILDEIMLKAIPAPRDTVGEFAPKMLQIKIPTDKIRDVIGQGGKVIQKMSAECGVKIDVNEDGHVFISGISMEGCRKAYQMIETIAIDPEVGSIYKGKVVSIKPFGAFVEIAPGRDGLVHISKLDKERVEQVEDVVSVGDAIIVKVMDIKDGKISLSRKDALEELEARRKQQETE